MEKRPTCPWSSRKLLPSCWDGQRSQQGTPLAPAAGKYPFGCVGWLVWLFVESVYVQLINPALIFWSCCCKNSWKLECQRWPESRASVGWLDLWKPCALSLWATCGHAADPAPAWDVAASGSMPCLLFGCQNLTRCSQDQGQGLYVDRTVNVLSRWGKKCWCPEEIAEYRVVFFTRILGYNYPLEGGHTPTKVYALGKGWDNVFLIPERMIWSRAVLEWLYCGVSLPKHTFWPWVFWRTLFLSKSLLFPSNSLLSLFQLC